MMTLQHRIELWQAAAQHHALSYYGMSVVIAPFLLEREWSIVRVHVVQTWFETPAKNKVRVTFKRGMRFNGRRIEIRVNGDSPIYFGPQEVGKIKTLLTSL